MKTYLLPLLALAVLALFSGCETVSTIPIQAQRTSAIFSAPKDSLWPLLVAEVGLVYPVSAIEKDSGLISTDWVTLPAGFNNMHAASWIVPPGGFLATWAGLRMNMKIFAVETEPGKTQVTINCHYEAFEDNVQKRWLVANTNGSVENSMLTKIEKQLLTAPATDPSKAVQSKPAASVKSPGDALIELKKLLDAGAITQAEYAEKRKSALEKL